MKPKHWMLIGFALNALIAIYAAMVGYYEATVLSGLCALLALGLAFRLRRAK